MIFCVELGASLFCLEHAPGGLSVFIICNPGVPRLTAHVVYSRTHFDFSSYIVEGGSGHQEFAPFVRSLTGHGSSFIFAQNKKGMTKDFCDDVMEKMSLEYKKKINDQFEKYQQIYNIAE